jgi:hypothetical protein
LKHFDRDLEYPFAFSEFDFMDEFEKILRDNDSVDDDVDDEDEDVDDATDEALRGVGAA